jgi:glycosyltransferase involved in cell wall biosynthesis
MKIDLHVHSKCSRRPSEWILKTLGCPESFTEPLHLHSLLKKQGMTRVTITDHNSIEGCLEIGHLEDTFISEEVTTYFPEDRCKLHVVVYNINESIHEEIQRIRENVYDLVDYLQQESIVHVLAHPLFSVNRKLTPEHFERCLLLFKNFELNGARSDEQNHCISLVLSLLTPEIMDQFSEKYGIVPTYPAPWIKNTTSGSDDHSSLTVARSYTEVQGASSVEDFLRGLQEGRAHANVLGSGPKTLARHLYGIAYQFYEHKFGLDRYGNGPDILKILNRFLVTDTSDRSPGILARIGAYWNNRVSSKKTENKTLLEVLKFEANKIFDDPQLAEVINNGNGNGAKIDLDEKWFRIANVVSGRVLSQFADEVVKNFYGAHFLNLFKHLGSAGAFYSLLSPYFVSFSVQAEGRVLADTVLNRFLRTDQSRKRTKQKIKVAHFTDTLHEINGVAHTLKQQVAAAERLGKDYIVISCGAGTTQNHPRIKNFQPIGTYNVSVYPEQKLFYPPLLEMLDYCYEQEFTHIHAATPGPIGLAALAISRTLNIPRVGTYHTALPQYAEILTDDALMMEVIWKYVLWFYDQLEIIYVPSQSTGQELIDKGISQRKIRLYPRGVDITRFHPAKRNDCLDTYCRNRDHIRLLYVGRISREKNLSLLAGAFRTLSESRKDLSLFVVGDGPYRQPMEESLAGTNTHFLGYIEGEALEHIYASCDVFVFPSTTETFGNVVLEAQASGIPVIVTDEGGAQENVFPGKTGLVVKGNSEESLLNGMRFLVSDHARMESMGEQARVFAETRSFDKAFSETWKLYEQIGSMKNQSPKGGIGLSGFDPLGYRAAS